MGGRTTWSKEEDEKLLALAEEGLTFSAIGEALGRGKNACIGRAHRLKVYISELQPKRVKQPTPKPEKVARPAPVKRIILPVIKQDNLPTPRYEQPEAATTAFGIPSSLLRLETHHCRWPVDERHGRHFFCSADRDGLGPYCREHTLIAWRPARMRISAFERLARRG